MRHKKTDNPELVGKHCFEIAGLGEAPFRFVGCQKAPSGCQYCGTAITYRFYVQDKNGKQFYVGCDCIERTGDLGLVYAYKTHPEYRKMQAEKAKAKDQANIDEWNAMLADPAKVALLEKKRVPDPRYWLPADQKAPDGMRPWLDTAKFAWGGCGASGRAKWLRAAKKVLAGDF